MPKPPLIVPALPRPSGPDARRAQFYREAAAAFEWLALWHDCNEEEQRMLAEATQSAAASVAGRRVKER